MLELWLIRHGETDWNHVRRWQGQTDIPLNATGLVQAGRLSPRLRHQTFDGVYSSDLGRTRMTANLAMPHMTPTFDRRLREMNFGHFEGKSWDDMTADERTVVSKWWRNPYYERLPSGESFQDLGARLEEWRKTVPTGRYAVFTHGGPIRCMLWQILGPPQEREWTIILSNASITRISWEEDRTTIISVNDCAHLEVPAPAPEAAESHEGSHAQ